MDSERLSAKDAIEALKAYQLQNVNADILEKIRAIKEDINNWEASLNETHKDVQELTKKSKRVDASICKHEKQVSQLEAGSKGHIEEMQRLRRSGTALDEKVSTIEARLDLVRSQHEERLSSFQEGTTQLSQKVKELEQTLVQVNEKLAQDNANAVEKATFQELEGRLEDFMRDVNASLPTIQGHMEVEDSHPYLHNCGLGGQHHVENASTSSSSSSANPPQCQASPQQDSNPDRWEPTDPQIVVRATPPHLLETLPVVARQEDSDFQTPSTFRAESVERGDVSNIAHARRVYLDEHIEDRRRKRFVETSDNLGQHEQGDNWVMLSLLLQLRQEGGEGLLQYFARVADLTGKFGSDHDVVPVCLRRFVSGIADDQTKEFVQTWLTTSDWTLESARDCIFLMTRYCAQYGMTRPELRCENRPDVDLQSGQQYPLEHPGHSRSVHTVTKNRSRSMNPLGSPFGDPRILASNAAVREGTRQARRTRAQDSGQRTAARVTCDESNNETRVQTAANAHKLDGQRPPLSQEPVSQVAANSVPETMVPDKQNRKPKKWSKGVGERELRSLLGSHIIDGPPGPGRRSLKRKTLHKADEDTLQNHSAAHAAQDRQKPSPDMDGPTAKRVPKLVAKKSTKSLNACKTGDAAELPDTSAGLHG